MSGPLDSSSRGRSRPGSAPRRGQGRRGETQIARPRSGRNVSGRGRGSGAPRGGRRPRGRGGSQPRGGNRGHRSRSDDAPHSQDLQSLDREDADLALALALSVAESPGKKGRATSAQHLLNFRYEDRQPASSAPGRPRRTKPRPVYNKDQFVQASFRFILHQGSYEQNLLDPNVLIDWDDVAMVLSPMTEAYECPVCLHPPTVPRITKCGHVFCWPCILRYLSYSDKKWRRCPLCFESVRKDTLRPARLVPYPNPRVGEEVTLQLVCRLKGSLVPYRRSSERTAIGDTFLDFHHPDSIYSRIMLIDDSSTEIPDLELSQLQTLLAEAQSSQDIEAEAFINEAIEAQRVEVSRRSVVRQRHDEKAEEEVASKARDSSPERLRFARVVSQPAWSDEEEEAPSARSSVSEPKQASEPRFSTDSASGHTEAVEAPPMPMADETTNVRAPDSGTFYWYQDASGTLLFLDSLNMRMLEHEHGGPDHLPNEITAKILQIDRADGATQPQRRAPRFLGHIPSSAPTSFCEINMAHLVSQETLRNPEFSSKLKQRANKRKKSHAQAKAAARRAEKQHVQDVKKATEDALAKRGPDALRPLDHESHESVHVPRPTRLDWDTPIESQYSYAQIADPTAGLPSETDASPSNSTSNTPSWASMASRTAPSPQRASAWGRRPVPGRSRTSQDQMSDLEENEFAPPPPGTLSFSFDQETGAAGPSNKPNAKSKRRGKVVLVSTSSRRY